MLKKLSLLICLVTALALPIIAHADTSETESAEYLLEGRSTKLSRADARHTDTEIILIRTSDTSKGTHKLKFKKQRSGSSCASWDWSSGTPLCRLYQNDSTESSTNIKLNFENARKLAEDEEEIYILTFKLKNEGNRSWYQPSPTEPDKVLSSLESDDESITIDKAGNRQYNITSERQ